MAKKSNKQIYNKTPQNGSFAKLDDKRSKQIEINDK
jgi:hypothetical protein